MAVTASAASEQIAVSSIVSHDLYLRYVNPRATGRQVLFAARCGIVGWACGSGVLAVLLLSLDIGLGWAYNAMGNFIGSAVAPIAFALTWRDCSAAGALAGAWVGAAVALLTWTLCARRLGALSVATLGDETCMLSGNLAALLVSPAITVAVSLLAPQRFDWRLTQEPALFGARFDEAKLQQALTKIFENAVESFAPPKGGLIAVETCNVELSAPSQDRNVSLAAGSYVCVGITDTGLGMTEDISARARPRPGLWHHHQSRRRGGDLQFAGAGDLGARVSAGGKENHSCGDRAGSGFARHRHGARRG